MGNGVEPPTPPRVATGGVHVKGVEGGLLITGRKLSPRDKAVMEMYRARGHKEPPKPPMIPPPDYREGDMCRRCWEWVNPMVPMFIQNWFHRRNYAHSIVLTGRAQAVERGGT